MGYAPDSSTLDPPADDLHTLVSRYYIRYSDLRFICEWAKRNILKLNLLKTKAISQYGSRASHTSDLL